MATGSAAAGGGGILAKKIGGVPVPVIGVIVVGIVGYMYWRSKKNASAATAATSAATGTTAATPAVTPASDYGAPTGFSLAGGGGTPPWAQPVPVATTPAAATAATPNQSQLGSGYGILNSQFPTQGVLSVPTTEGTFTELNSSGNAAYGGQAAAGTAGNYYQPTPGTFTPITAGDTLSAGTPIFGLTPAAAAAA
jgi:hypothetical protein